MNKKLLLFFAILFISESQEYSITQCTCAQLQSQGDCYQNISHKCLWDDQKKLCSQFVVLPIPTIIYPSYCDSYTKIICPNIEGCAWVDNYCTSFTGCTPFVNTKDSDCKAISNKCTTDGTHCIEIDDCNTYQTQQACRQNAKGQYCYWDTIDNKCYNADSCERLPNAFDTDEQCRDQIKTCITTSGGGCIESGLTCSDQKFDYQCFWNKDKTIRCYWDGSFCKDKTCINAPLTLKTNLDCDSFLKGCITKRGGGCIQNESCSVADTKDACINNSNNMDCFWDGICLEKICKNAPKKYNTHLLCTQFLPTCTVNPDGGCIQKSCNNAPQTLTTNDACESYLPENNCITKIEGGCIINTTCQAITLKMACFKNQYGQDCFWDLGRGECKDKICVNAPSSNNSHALCQTFSFTCTVNSNSSGCAEKTCQNLSDQYLCDKDQYNNKCIWKSKCYQKQCVFAPLTFRTHSDCQSYLPSCTLSNTGFGCSIIPLKCEAITAEAACQIKANGSQCGWNGSQCIDKSCSTAPKQFTTTLQCQTYLSNCVAKNLNVVNGITFSGCQDLPITCQARKSSEDCEIAREEFPTCLWDSLNQICVKKSCSTAIIVGTTGALSEGKITYQTCQQYLNSCISNNYMDGCMIKPYTCSFLTQENCQIGSKWDGDCYWNGVNCVDRTCSNIILKSHNDCNNTFEECTVNNQATQCQQIAKSCIQYESQQNCQFIQSKQNCYWTGLTCRNATCADAPDNSFYDTNEECFNFSSHNEVCTVVYKVGAVGCVQKEMYCADYMAQSQCHKTITNLTQNDDCIWIIDKCYSLSTFEKGPCSKFKGTQEMCQAYKLGCTNEVYANSKSSCILDCTLKTGLNLTFQDCQTLDPTCSVRKDGTGCIILQNTCQDYGMTTDNCFRASSGFCAMNQNPTPTCQAITSGSECQFVSNLTGLDHKKCQQYNTSCTSLNDGFGCQEKKPFCSEYYTANNCTISQQGKCYFNGSNCTRFTKCSSIVGSGMTNEICQSYNTECTSNANRTACQEKESTCELYKSQISCTFSRATNPLDRCIWTGLVCQHVISPTSDCAYIKGIDLNDAICQSYSFDCTVNKTGTACQQKKPMCQDYINQISCTFSKAAPTADKCVWNEQYWPFCKNVTTIFDCVYIIGVDLTDSICSSYYYDCTVNRARTACQEKKPICDYYLNYDQCTFSKAAAPADRCVWNQQYSSCQSINNPAIECAFIIGIDLTDSICSSYHYDCTVNRARTACQEKKAVCDLYLDYGQCTFSKAAALADRCVWNQQYWPFCRNVTTIADCVYIIGVDLTDSICSSYHYDCTVNRARTACQEKKAICDYYLNYDQCKFSKAAAPADRCVWNQQYSSCQSLNNPAIECAFIIGIDLTDAICRQYHTDCKRLKDGTGCQVQKAACKEYSTSNQCESQIDGISCFWYENSCNSITAASCNSIVESSLDHVKCQAYNTSCTVNSLGNACQDLQSTCEEYQGTALNCTRTLSSKCYLYNGNTCITIQNVQNDCAKITGNAGTITFDLCQSYNNGCSVNRTKSACVQIQDQCSGYSNVMTNCYKSKAGFCISSTNIDTACISASSVSNCYQLFLGSGNYNDINCNEFKSGCTVEGITSCTPRTCGNATGFTFNHINCNNWLQTCTVDNTNSKCVNISLKCKDQTKESCLFSKEGPCVVFGDVCVKQTCDTANSDSNFDTDSECSLYLQQCTVARTGGCQARSSCQSYKSSIQCKFNNVGQKCFWNQTIKTCVDFQCENIEQTFLYDTHLECSSVDPTCTVRSQNEIAVPGCMSKKSCNSYTIVDQCVTNQNGDVCIWNTNLLKPECQDISCSTAPISLKYHEECQLYYNTPLVSCTVFAHLKDDNILTLGGCQQTTDCYKYIHQEQCQINGNGDPCQWNGQQCFDKSCATAPKIDEYYTDKKCRDYFNNLCTVLEDGQGCVEIPALCETMKENQCYYNKNGDQCFWTGTECITKVCENAPQSIIRAGQCNDFLIGCTQDDVKCKVQVCEDYNFITDEQCKESMPTCTTNGQFCVTRGKCIQALHQAGCIKSITGEDCQWIPSKGIDPAYCTLKNCQTAPISLHTEQDCQKYFNNCTAKKGGGCIEKTTCHAASVQSACTNDIDGKTCQWDNIVEQCRYRDCQDLTGTLHFSCQALDKNCTAGPNGKCIRIEECESFKNRRACIKGTNGPCLWIDKYLNSDGSQGACFKYTSCQSLAWNTDDQCKLISNLCTTDGSKCVPITKCSETNTNGGCVTGSDGICIQTLPALNSLESKICKPFKSCSDAFYITHQECQIANKQCTTDGKTGCISLNSCQSYLSQIGCQIDNIGVVIQSGNIISTGICIWDEKANVCRDQSCSEIKGTTHNECYAILSKCTSDGTSCLKIDSCSSYTTQSICTAALGSDGICFWESASIKNNNRAQCRLLVCQDIQNIESTNSCVKSQLSCVLDGNLCIPKANCSTYTSKAACNSGGLDGICVFTQNTDLQANPGIGTCALMTQCSQAKNDQNACQAAKDRCQWTSQSKNENNVIPSRCSSHTCATFQALIKSCTRFYNWDKKSQQICIIKDGNCVVVDPGILGQEDCLLVSGYTYSWDTSKNKCQVCKVLEETNISNNTTIHDDKNESTLSSQIVRVTAFIVFHLYI